MKFLEALYSLEKLIEWKSEALPFSLYRDHFLSTR